MRSDQAHLRTVTNHDGAAILDTKNGIIATLNPTGARVWDALLRGEDINTIAVKLAEETGEQLGLLLHDLQEFVKTLQAQQLLID